MRRLALIAVAVALLCGAALGRMLNLESMPVGYVLSRDEVIDTFGRNVVRAGMANYSAGAFMLDDTPATTKRREDPSWLLLSNAPEILDDQSLPLRRGVLVSSDVPAGRIRVLVSHSNRTAASQDFVLRMSNSSDDIADVTLETRAAAKQSLIPGTFSVDATVGGLLARGYMAAARSQPLGWRPPDGDRHRLIRQRESSDARLVTDIRGLGMSWLTLTTSTPLHLTVFSVPSNSSVDGPVVPRVGSQARGLFQNPDVDVEATIDVDDGRTTRYVFGGAERNNGQGLLMGGNWMIGTDTTVAGQQIAQVNRGDFGGITSFQATIKGTGSEYKGVMFVLVAGGRKAAVLPLKEAKPVVLNSWEGLILGRAAIGETFRYEFTLPPNSWAPVYMVALPVHHL